MEQALAGRWGPTVPVAEPDDAGEAPPERGFRVGDRPSDAFRMHVVDINRTSKGTKAGGVLHFTAMCVVGNGEVGRSFPLARPRCCCCTKQLTVMRCLLMVQALVQSGFRGDMG